MQLLRITQIHTALENMLRAVADAATQRQKSVVDKHSRGTNVVRPYLNHIYYVFVRSAVDRAHNIRFKWYRPCIVTDVHHPLVLSVRSLISGYSEHAHSGAPPFYLGGKKGVPLSTAELNIAERNEAHLKVIERIADIGGDANLAYSTYK